MTKYSIAAAIIVFAVSMNISVLAGDIKIGDASGIYSVADFGAKGDGKTDDTSAFQKALNEAGKRGGTVLVPPVSGGMGYVITRTVKIPVSTSLIGSLAGLSTNSWAAFPMPETHVTGAKIFARPAASQYIGKTKKPLFELSGGSTVRGFWITYDRQPWPTDEEFQDPSSPYHYDTFEEARTKFISKHAKPYGPVFYIPGVASNNVLEDITCDRYYDFFFQVSGARTFIRRINLYGYKRAFVFAECADVNRITEVHCVPGIGYACPGKTGPGRTFSWIYGIIASQKDSIGIQIGRSDGFVFRDTFFYGVNTAVRLGASVDYPLIDTVSGTRYFYDLDIGKSSGFNMPYNAQGPWGDLSDFSVESCAQGIHLVWPSPQTVKILNGRFSTGIFDGTYFKATGGTGDISKVGKQGAIISESTYSRKNNIGIIPTLICSGIYAGSFEVIGSFGPAGLNAESCNGRLFLLNSDLNLDITGMLINYPYRYELFSARGTDAGKISIKVRGFYQTGEPYLDLESDGAIIHP